MGVTVKMPFVHGRRLVRNHRLAAPGAIKPRNASNRRGHLLQVSRSGAIRLNTGRSVE